LTWSCLRERSGACRDNGEGFSGEQSMSKHQRRQIFIDRPIQLAVMLRTTLYWVMGTIAHVLMVLFFALITTSKQDFISFSPQLWWQLQISLIASAVILPIILLDVLRLSHRWVGPIFRLRATLKSLGKGEAVPTVRFRDGDFWQDLAGDLNAVSAKLNLSVQGCEDESDVAESSKIAVAPSEAKANRDLPASAIAP
jgi:hypothetical protein